MNVNQRLYTLDGMRGIAAVLVVLFHMGSMRWIAQSGYLAVDFFFMLSGLVIARAYEERLRTGLGLGAFLLARVIRFYPMYILGVLLSALTALAMIVKGSEGALTFGQIMLVLSSEMFMMPSPVSWSYLFPLNGPAWSLFFELLVNLLFAALLVRLGVRPLIVILALTLLGLVLVIGSYADLGHGDRWGELDVAAARVGFSFVAGVLLHRSGLATPTGEGVRALPLLLIPILLLTLPRDIPAKGICDLIIVAAVCPVLVCLGARWQPARRWRAPCEMLGDLSYPLYAIHFPIIYAIAVFSRWFSIPASIWVPSLFLMLIVGSLLLGRYIDPFARKKLAQFVRDRLKMITSGRYVEA